MNDIKKEIDILFDELKKTDTYKEYVKVVENLHENKKIMDLIGKVKRYQKIAVNNKDKVVENELEKLYKVLDSYPLYQSYLIKKDNLEEELKQIKNMFELYFNDILKIK